MRGWWLVVTAACGRLGFDPAPGGSAITDADIVPFDIAFDAPLACLPATPPPSCSPSSGVTALAAGTFHTCVIRNGGLTCWGENMTGALGFCDAPLVLVPTTTFAFPAAQIALGELHTCVRLVDGQAWCWGSRFEGESGDGISTEWSAVPRRIGGQWRDIASRRYHTCGIDTAGALWCWGRNDEGQLGLGDTMDRGTPQRVGTSTWSRVVTGGAFTCALDPAGAAYCWGDNSDGAVGDGTRMMRTTPSAVVGGIRFRTLTAGKTHVCGSEESGTTWCWGHGAQGQLGNGRLGPQASELQPFAIGTFASVVAAWFYTCALDAAGALSCWGDNTTRALSSMNQDTITTPLAIAPGPFVELAAGGYQTCVLANDVVSCLGNNDRGQLGVGDTQPRTTLQPLCF